MFKKITLGTAAAIAAFTAMPAAAEAQNRYGYYDQGRYERSYRDDRGYRSNRYYQGNRYNGRYDNRRYRSRSCSGSTGTIVGGVAGALLGREVAGRGDRTAETIIGGAIGALAGRAIDKSSC